MKRLATAVTLVLALASTACAAGQLNLGNGFSVGFSTSMDVEGVGARDLQNGQWLSGVSKELIPAFKGETKLAYIAAEQLFDLDDAGKGMFGLALGIPTGAVTQGLQSLLEKITPRAKLPQWVRSISNWTSLEVGGGYRFYGRPDNVTPWTYTVGGRVKVPLGDLWSKKAE